MFEDFLKSNYWRTKNKLRKLRELINRIDVPKYEENLLSIGRTLDNLDLSIEELSEYVKEREVVEEVVENLPDLIVDSIIPSVHSKYVNFAITVKNIGTAVASASTLNAVIASISNVNLSIPALNPNETTTVYHQYSFDPNGIEEQKTLVATADVNDSVRELNENNNTKSAQATVKSPYSVTGLIVHCHNPEGKEIGSISGITVVDKPSLSHGTVAINEATHGVPSAILAGNYTVTATFNGIQLNQNVTIIEGNTTEIFFHFPRTELSASFNDSDTAEISEIFSLLGNASIFDHRTFPVLTFGTFHFDMSTHTFGWADGSYEASGSYSLSPTSWNANVEVSCAVEGYLWDNEPHIYLNLLGVGGDNFINVPATSEFTNWYQQSIKFGDYPGIIIRTGDYLHAGRLVEDAPDVRGFRKFSTDYTYTNGGGSLFLGADVQLNQYPYLPSEPPVSRSDSDSDSQSGSADIFVSSVPFDFAGTAV